ncbi:MAG: type III-A CRISPR-associated RAMP protein Csm5, partial [Chloroflexaceae bacterium]
NWYDRGNRELYDLAADPRETRNLAAGPAAASVRKELEARLDAEEERLKRRRERNIEEIKQFEQAPPKDRQQYQRTEQRLRQEASAVRQALEDLRLRRAELEARMGEMSLALPIEILHNSAFTDLLKTGLLTLDDMRKQASVDGRPLVRYALDGRPAVEEILAQIKDVADRPYLPGSSLKGALRSALAWEAAARLAPVSFQTLAHVGAKQADDQLEAAIFLGRVGDNQRRVANKTLRDVLRALRVGDSAPLDGPPALLEVAILNSRSQRATRLAVEAIPPGARLEATLRLERYPFENQQARQVLDFGDWTTRLTPEALAAACRRRAAALIAGERHFFERQAGATEVLRFYADLHARLDTMGDRACLLPLGWGAGWRSKTLDDRLRDGERKEAVFAETVRRFKLKKHKSDAFGPGDEFPQTRKIALAGGRPWRPLGWIQVDIEEEA